MILDSLFEPIKVFMTCIGIFYIFYLIGYSTFLFLAVVIGAITMYRGKQRTILKNIKDESYYVPVSIIVPAYNEEMTVVETVRSLLALDYKLYEIIVVDDGSRDNTSGELIKAFRMRQIRQPIRRRIPCQKDEFTYQCFDEKVSLTLIRKKNGGKADALNLGINAAQYPYFICIDADSVLQHDSLREIVRPVLEDSTVIAVGGCVRPCNDVELEQGRVVKYRMPRNILASMQVLEYDRSFLAARILFDKFNGSLIISGAFGLFKKDMVIACGGYDHSTMGEDMELVVRMHEFCACNNIPYRVRYAEKAICWTQAPERMRDLRTQRRRWHLGLFQSMNRHRGMFVNLKYGPVSLISYLYFLIYELLSPYIEIFGVLTVLLAFAVDLINVPFMILFFLIYALFSAVLSLTAFFSRVYSAGLSLSLRDVIKAILLCLFEISILRFFLAFIRATAFRGYRKKKMSWGSIQRKSINLK